MKVFSLKKRRPNKLIAWLTLGIFSLQPVLCGAQAVADTSAAANNRPAVNTAQNGTEIVQITAPSAAGISRNLYQQFDVDPKGLILNNSLTSTNTQLAGYIQGNANLAGGSARIILNEVTGSNISSLGGCLEVAGQRADVIIANHNGIVGNGFSFINTSRGVLTTGTPVFGGSGSLDAFRVTGGNISVQGKGIDAAKTDRVDLISRAVSVNAGIWAKELNVVTGSNNVDSHNLNTQTIAGDSNQPQVALDVSALGGMYADKIKLVGTEHGVGVNSQGTVTAAGGDLILNNDGKVMLGGKLNAGGSINIYSTDDIQSTGIAAAGNTIKAAGKAVNNTGTLTAGSLAVDAETITNAGDSALMAGSRDITLNASNYIENKDGAAIYSKGSIIIAGSDQRNNGQPVDKANSLLNQSAIIKADGDITIYAGDITNKRRIFEVGKTVSDYANSGVNEKQLSVKGLAAYNDSLVSHDSGENETWWLSKTVEELQVIQDSPEGNISAGRNMYLQANTINNDKSSIVAAGILNASGTVNNTAQELYRTTTRYLAAGKVTRPSYIPLELTRGITASNAAAVKIIPGLHAMTPEWKMSNPLFYSDMTVEQTSNITALFGGGQQVIIQAPSVNNITKDSVNAAQTGSATGSPGSQKPSGAIITAKNVQITTTQDIINQNSKITGDTVKLVAGRDIRNEATTNTVSTVKKIQGGSNEKTTNLINFVALLANDKFLKYGSSEQTIAGQTAEISATGNVTIAAGQDVQIVGGELSAGTNINVDAGRNLNIGAVATNEKTVAKNYQHDITANLVSNIQAGGSVTMASQQDTNLSSAQVEAGQDLSVKSNSGNINISTVSDTEALDEKTGSSKNWTRRSPYDEIVLNSSLQALGNINVSAVNPQKSINPNGGSITIASGDIYSDTGAIKLNADKDVTIQEAIEQHISRVQTHKKKRSLLSSKTTDKIDYSLTNEVEGSSVSGESVDVSAGEDLNIKGSVIVAANDLKLQAENDVNLTIAKETGVDEHYKRVKKSGIFGSGGILGITIGKQSTTTKLNEQVKAEIGNVIGSVSGNVDIIAGNNIKSAGTLVTSGKDTFITGKTVTIDNSIDTYDSQYKYEFKQSGLTISLGGALVDAGTSLANNLERADDVQDKRLKALYEYKALKDLNTLKKLSKNLKSITDGLAVNVSLGSSKTTTEQTIHEEIVNMSCLTAGGNVIIKAAEGDINLDATSVNAANVLLDAKKNLNIGSAQNIMQTNTNTESSSVSVGVSVSPAGTVSGANIGGSASQANENEEITTYTESVIVANDTAVLKSGSDTNILGSQVKAENVLADVGANLNIASQQDTAVYTADSQNGGVSIGIGNNNTTKGSAGMGKTDSDYKSVIEQAGIYAGQYGFDIYVEKNTDLKGAVISSQATPDKNILSTGTLTWSDIQNKAEYEASSVGVNVGIHDGKASLPIPNLGTPASGDASSTTQSAISPGTIDVRSNPNIDLNKLSRDPSGSVNALGQIFDKKTVQEQQELAAIFGAEAFWLIGEICDKQGWEEGSPEKIALHALVGGIMADLGGANASSGAVGAGFNEAVQNELSNITDPVLRQWASALIGAASASLVGGDAQTGATTALYGTKYNNIPHAAKSALKALLALGPKGLRILQRLGFATEEEVLASEASMVRFLQEYNIWQARLVGFRNTAYDFAVQGTKNPESTEVVLGKYIEGSIESYEAIAMSRGATFFQLDNYARIVAEFGEANMWLINKMFLYQQCGKTILLTSNPYTATGYFAQEVAYLQNTLQFQFIQIGPSLWQAVR